VAVFLVGHGSYDGNEYKFNIPGPDITGEKLRELMDGLPASRQLVVVTGSSSGALLDILARDDRTVITATRSGAERNATRFGAWFAEALVSGAADINKNDYVSVREAYDYTARAVEEYFDTEGTLATEHSQVNGDGAMQFNLARLAPDDPVEISPEAGELIGRRDELDERILDLQLRRSEMTTEEYYDEIEVLMIELARIEEDIEADAGGKAGVEAGQETEADTEDGIEDDIESEAGDIDDIIAAGIDVGMGTGIGEDLEIIGVDLLGEDSPGDDGDIDGPDAAGMESDTPAAAVESDEQESGDD
jgi:hypothetical protein